jgi:DNA-binding transcriptional ArsR family regulator
MLIHYRMAMVEMTGREDRCEIRHINEDMVHRAEMQLVDGLTATQLADFFKALSDPTRVRILSALTVGELCVCDLATTLGMTQSAISHQLRLLRQLRLVKRRKVGKIAYYSFDDEHVSNLLREGIDHARHP